MTAPWHLTAAEMDAAWDDLTARLAEIIGYCAQEGHDGEPYDTINAIATGAYSTRGGGTDSAEAAADVFAAMNLPTHTFPSITSSAHKPGCAVFSVSPFRAQRPDCDCGADLAAPDQPGEAGK